MLRLRDWIGDELRVERAAKDRKLGGVVRGPKKATGVKTLPVSGRLREWLDAYVPASRRLGDPDGPLFLNPDGREGWWSETSLRRTWGKACRHAGVPGVGLYEGTKHSSATKVQGRAIRSALALLDPPQDDADE